jgi:hypothetical protein
MGPSIDGGPPVGIAATVGTGAGSGAISGDEFDWRLRGSTGCERVELAGRVPTNSAGAGMNLALGLGGGGITLGIGTTSRAPEVGAFDERRGTSV